MLPRFCAFINRQAFAHTLYGILLPDPPFMAERMCKWSFHVRQAFNGYECSLDLF